MPAYRNLGGGSNVSNYEIGVGVITVTFGDGSVYEYTNARYVGHKAGP